jgi:hypothetical protein
VQCPVHRQPRAKIHFLCALSGGSPDSYCALSGVHRTGTVDCPVRPYSVFKNFSLPEPSPGSVFSPCCARFLSRSGDSTGDLRAPAATVLDHPPATSSPSSFPLSVSFSSLSLFLSVHATSAAPFPLFCKSFKTL